MAEGKTLPGQTNDISPQHQNHHYESYPGINGTEGNRVLDTEDLNGNGILDQLDRYFSYGVAVTGNEHLVNVNHSQWRLYRIPLHDPEAHEVVTDSPTGVKPSLQRISYARLSLETDIPARIYIADISVVGNKWQDFGVRDFNNVALTEDQEVAIGTTTSPVSDQPNQQLLSPSRRHRLYRDRRQSVESSSPWRPRSCSREYGAAAPTLH